MNEALLEQEDIEVKGEDFQITRDAIMAVVLVKRKVPSVLTKYAILPIFIEPDHGSFGIINPNGDLPILEPQDEILAVLTPPGQAYHLTVWSDTDDKPVIDRIVYGMNVGTNEIRRWLERHIQSRKA